MWVSLSAQQCTTTMVLSWVLSSWCRYRWQAMVGAASLPCPGRVWPTAVSDGWSWVLSLWGTTSCGRSCWPTLGSGLPSSRPRLSMVRFGWPVPVFLAVCVCVCMCTHMTMCVHVFYHAWYENVCLLVYILLICTWVFVPCMFFIKL